MPVKEHRAKDYLTTPEAIAACLNLVVEESEGDSRLLIKALRNVADTQGGLSEIARRADVDRAELVRGLAGGRDPGLETAATIASACGVRLRFVA